MKSNNEKIIISLSVLILFFGAAKFSSAENADYQKDLKSKIDSLRSQIQIFQDEIYSKSEQEETIQSQINMVEKEIKKIELQIQETELIVQSLNIDIEKKQSEVDAMQKEVDVKKKMLIQFMQELYERGEATPIEMVLGNESFSDYFFQADSLESFEERANEIYDQFVFLRDGLKNERKNLIVQKEEQMNLRGMQNDQRQGLDSQKKSKDRLLSRTKTEKMALAEQMEKLQEQLGALQSLGNPINIEEAISAARYASKLTKVAPEFLLGVLRIESGLGTNVGGGRYKADMNPAQWDNFKMICKELKKDPDDVPVSRRVCYNTDSKDGCGGWGGAMGPAQFMPATWMGYKSKVEKATGKAPADPWALNDSLVAMGFKLSQIDGVVGGNRKAWAKAAGIYLAGNNWENYSWYSDRVLSYADGYKKMIK